MLHYPDGGSFASPRVQLAELPPKSSKTMSLLNNLLRKTLSDTQLQDYIEFQKQFFQIPLCKKHEIKYFNHLKQQKTFQPEKCCVSIKSTSPYNVKIESAGDYSVIFGMNMAISFDKFEKLANLKSSGFQSPTISCLMQLSQNSTQMMVLQKISELIVENSQGDCSL